MRVCRFYFRTWPSADDSGEAVRLWVLGDSGTDKDDQRNARDAFEVWNAENPFGGDGSGCMWDATIPIGDNAYEDGTDSQYQVRVCLVDIFTSVRYHFV